MALTLKALTLKGKYIEAVFEGEIGTSRLQPAVFSQEILSFCQTSNCYRLLIDHSAVRYQTNILGEHRFGLFVAEKFPPTSRLVIVASKDIEPHQTHLQDVVTNRSMNLRVFWDRDEALVWLLAD